ncbi:MAG: efflux RND transporter permease subunit, partial [bacterium]
MSLPDFSVKRKVTVSMLMMVVVLGGIVAFSSLGLDLMPEMEYPMITVVTSYEGVAPEDVENTVTKSVEDAVGTIEGIKNIYSTSMEGVSVVILEFAWGTNLDSATQDVRDNLDMVRMMMPSDSDEPLVLKFNISQMPIIFYGITGMRNTMELREYLDDNVKPRLERLEGVASVMLFGGEEKEIAVFADRVKLDAYGVSTEEIAGAITSRNVNVSAGNLKGNHTEHFVRSVGEYKSIKDIENTIIKKQNGVSLYVKDVAEVAETFKERRDITSLDGKDAVLVMISKQSGANTVTATDRVKKELEVLKGIMPENIHYFPVFDQGHIIKKILSATLLNVLTGGVLAVLFLYFFLRNARPVVAIAVAIPTSIITTFIGLFLMKYTFNIFTMAGFALVVGMLVDNAVVAIENIFRHLEEGEKRPVAAAGGTNEVSMAITTSTLTTIAVFLPMVLSKGLAGQISRPMALTITVGLVCSLFVALTIVPMIASVLFSEKTKDTGSEDSGKFKYINKLKNAYKNLLCKALNRRKFVLISAAALFILCLFLLKVTGFEFMPEMDRPVIMLQFSMPVGTNLDETKRLAEYVNEKFLELPEKEAVFLQVGRSVYGAADAAMGTGPADVNEAMIMARVTDLEDRDRRIEQITEALRKKFPDLENVNYTFQDTGQAMMGSSAQAPVELKIFGKDLKVLGNLAEEISSKIKNIKGIRDVNITLKKGKPEYRIKIDGEKAAHYFLGNSAIGNTVRKALTGKVVSKFRSGGEETDIRIRFAESDRETLEDIENTVIRTPNITLKDVAEIEEGIGPLKIERENRLRKVVVTANVVDRPIGKVASDIKKELSLIPMPGGYFVEQGGTYKQMKDTMGDLVLALIAAIILIYMIMAAQFESFTQPFVIMFSVPLGIIGVMVGLTVMGMSFSVPAMMGVVILAGIVVNNGIVMVDFVNRLRAKGIPKYEALVEGAVLRLRPILITSLTTICGILPMAFSRSQGAEMRAPLGVAVSFG